MLLLGFFLGGEGGKVGGRWSALSAMIGYVQYLLCN